jgi:secretion/DNA translocation related CpaE-like protein
MSTTPALLVTADDLLLDDLLRLAAAAGTSLDVASDTTAALRSWSTAGLVLLGADLAGAVAGQRPPRRDQVHVVARGPVQDGLFRSALATGARDVLELPDADGWLVELLTDASDGTPRPARTIGLVAGSGGVGATTFACALALTAAGRAPAALVDLDPLGPGVDRVVGLDTGGNGVRWDALVGSRGRLGSRSLRAALPSRDGLAVLTWAAGTPVALDPGSVREVLSAARRGHDVVVVDLPRAVDDLTAEVVSRCDQVLVVADPTVPGAASAGKVIAALRPLTSGLALLVRVGEPGVPAEDVADVLDLPLVGTVPTQRRLAEQVDLGLGPVATRRSPLARAARAVLAAGVRGRAVA